MKAVGVVLVLAVLSVASCPVYSGAPAEYWPYWDRSNENNHQAIDHGIWNDILSRFVVMDEMGVASFRYGDMDRDSRGQLDAYISTMKRIDPRDYPKLEQKAYWMNLYNALSVEAVLENFQTLKANGFAHPLAPEVWERRRIKVAGEKLSLDDIEHRILRPIWKDHRIHFGLNCTTRECPNFALQAFTAKNIKEQLVASGSRFINLNSGVRYEDGVLSASRIFRDYMGDFATSEKTLKKVFAHYSKDMKALYVLGYPGDIRYLSDTRLNMP